MKILIIILIIIVAIVLFLFYGYISNFKYVVTHYEIESDELSTLSDNKPIIVMSDLHNSSFGEKNEKLIKKIDDISPKYILMVGDMVNNYSETNNQNARELVDYLCKKYNVIYSDGNHEQAFFGDEMGEFNEDKFNSFYSYLQSDKICDKVSNGNVFSHVVNSYIQIDNVRFYGLRIDREFYGRFERPDMKENYLNEMLGKSNSEYYNVLLAHNPLYFDNYASWGADLVVSGHVHGGLMRLPLIGGVISPQIKLFPKYTGGLYRINKKVMVLSRGLGTHTIRFRFFNPPELVVVHPVSRKR